MQSKIQLLAVAKAEPRARLQCCPKCGGTSGYEGVLVMRYQMTGAWGRAWETSGDEKAEYRSPSVKCSDCGHRVRTGIAEGHETPNVEAQPPAGSVGAPS